MPHHCVHCGYYPQPAIRGSREKVLSGLLGGYHIREIAARMNVSNAYVSQEVARLYSILGVKRRSQLSNYWGCELFQIGLGELGIYTARPN